MNENLRKLVRKHEGYSPIPYKCPAGKRTICYGYNLDAHTLPSDIAEYLAEHGSLQREMCERLLDLLLEDAIANCRTLYPAYDSYSENRRNALADWLYNIGLGTAKQFVTTNRLIRDGLWVQASLNLEKSKWYKQVGKRGKTICRMLREV
jgi:lysozyme